MDISRNAPWWWLERLHKQLMIPTDNIYARTQIWCHCKSALQSLRKPAITIKALTPKKWIFSKQYKAKSVVVGAKVTKTMLFHQQIYEHMDLVYNGLFSPPAVISQNVLLLHKFSLIVLCATKWTIPWSRRTWWWWGWFMVLSRNHYVVAFSPVCNKSHEFLVKGAIFFGPW